VDPDPFTVISAALAVAAIFMQFPQTAVALRQLKNPVDPSRQSTLDHLENTLHEFEKHLRRVERAIDQGSQNPAAEFYDIKFGISIAGLKLDIQSMPSFPKT
jgi:hypothetical protein